MRLCVLRRQKEKLPPHRAPEAARLSPVSDEVHLGDAHPGHPARRHLYRHHDPDRGRRHRRAVRASRLLPDLPAHVLEDAQAGPRRHNEGYRLRFHHDRRRLGHFLHLCQRADRHDPRQLAAQRHGQQVRLPVCRQHHHPDPRLPGRYLGHPACHDPDPMAGRGGDGHQHHPFRPHHLLQHDGRSVHAAVRHVPVHHLGHIRHAAQGYHSGDLVADHRHADRARRDHLHPRRGAVPAKAHRYDGLI